MQLHVHANFQSLKKRDDYWPHEHLVGDEVDADARYVPCDGHAQPAAESSQATRLVDIPGEVILCVRSRCSELTLGLP